MQSLPVIFRTDRSGETVAVFPTQCADSAGREMVCYAHIGQHGSCTREWFYSTRRATAEESRELLRELRGIYTHKPADGNPVALDVRLRITPQMRREFMADFYASRAAVAG